MFKRLPDGTPMITNWDQYTDALFEKLPNGYTRWVWPSQLRPLMSGKFGRLYDRAQRRVGRKSAQQRVIDGYSRRCVEVTTRKYRARRKRR
jgi:hypothetical protein